MERIGLKWESKERSTPVHLINDAPLLVTSYCQFMKIYSISFYTNFEAKYFEFIQSSSTLWLHAFNFRSNDDNCWQYQSNVNYFCELFDLFVKLIWRNVKIADVGKKSNHIQFVHVSCGTRTYPQCIMYVHNRTGKNKLEIAYFSFIAFPR